jgi:hypothetical protein
MAEATPIPGVVVPAVPPRPPQLTLIGSSMKPLPGADPPGSIWELGDEQIALLPDDLKQEMQLHRLSADEGWVRGLRYAPENQYPAVLRDFCDFTSVDMKALLAPEGLTATEEAGKGTIAAGALEYLVTAVNGNGETTAREPAAKVTLEAEGAVLLKWNPSGSDPEGEGNITYNVYGRKAGELKLLATVGPFKQAGGGAALAPEWLDTGAKVAGAKTPPASNTTGGAGSYGNLPIVEYKPVLIVVEDSCSSFGFESRDFKGRALRLLDNATPWALEREFWTGALAEAKGYPNNSLMNPAKVEDITPAGGPPGVERGLAILQDALSGFGGQTFGGQGMIHVQPQTTTSLLKVRRVGPLLLDIFDNIVVPGAGYPSTGPGGQVPEEGYAWIGASDLVFTRTEKDGTIFPNTFAEAFDWGQNTEPNTIRFRAQRAAAAYFDGARAFAVQVKLPE